MHADARERKGFLAINIGLGANVLLAALKTSVGILGHSPALLAEGINSTSDVAYYIVVSVFVRLAGRPPDDEHPYGHSQMESIAALIVGAFVMTTAIAIFWDAVNRVYDLATGRSEFAGALSVALWVALFTVVLKLALTLFTRRIGRQTRNPAVLALAYDHRNDIFSASAASVGVFLGRMGYPWVDPLAGATVALIILRTGIEIVRSAATELMDAVPGRELSEQITGVLGGIPGILAVEEIRAHRFGPYLVVNVTVGIDGSLTVGEADRIATQAEHTLCEQMDFVRRVHVHCHPAVSTPDPEVDSERTSQ
ncbi:MAG TPA: cation diffusion facilitator family transporter [Planctomycetota bacterium]|nr:cation diffusion facilitator family transporter [Planctomycetota bacterium]